jgi:hypothetical protein
VFGYRYILIDIFDKVTYIVFCRFLALKNLASVFLQQGSAHYEGALRCYLQAVEIDTKDSVIWNQLGTLSCSMGLLSMSRWAFEQGLLCSPNNCKHLFSSIKYFILIILYIAFYSLVFPLLLFVKISFFYVCLPYSLCHDFIFHKHATNYVFLSGQFVQGIAWRSYWKFLLLLVMRWHVFL